MDTAILQLQKPGYPSSKIYLIILSRWFESFEFFQLHDIIEERSHDLKWWNMVRTSPLILAGYLCGQMVTQQYPLHRGRWHIHSSVVPWASYQIRKIVCCTCAGNAGNVFPRHRLQRKTTSYRSRHASRHVRDTRAVMHVGIANRRWRGKRSRRMRNPNFYVSGERPIRQLPLGLTFFDNPAGLPACQPPPSPLHFHHCALWIQSNFLIAP